MLINISINNFWNNKIKTNNSAINFKPANSIKCRNSFSNTNILKFLFTLKHAYSMQLWLNKKSKPKFSVLRSTFVHAKSRITLQKQNPLFLELKCQKIPLKIKSFNRFFGVYFYLLFVLNYWPFILLIKNNNKTIQPELLSFKLKIQYKGHSK